MRLSGKIFPFPHMCWLLLITLLLLEWLPQLCAPMPSQELRSAGQPADPQVLLLALFENRSDIGFLSIHRIIFWWPESSKDCIPNFYLNDISQFDEPSWMCLIRFCGLADIQLISMSLHSVCLNGGLFMASDFLSWAQGLSFLKGNLTSKKQGKEGIE